jgi:WD40 repeat protein
MRLWDMSGGLINKWETNTAAVASCTFSPSGRHIICGSRDKTVAVYSNVTFQEVGRYICESVCSVCVCVSERERERERKKERDRESVRV